MPATISRAPEPASTASRSGTDSPGGMVVAPLQHRLTREESGDADIHDTQCALRSDQGCAGDGCFSDDVRPALSATSETTPRASFAWRPRYRHQAAKLRR